MNVEPEAGTVFQQKTTVFLNKLWVDSALQHIFVTPVCTVQYCSICGDEEMIQLFQTTLETNHAMLIYDYICITVCNFSKIFTWPSISLLKSPILSVHNRIAGSTYSNKAVPLFKATLCQKEAVLLCSSVASR